MTVPTLAPPAGARLVVAGGCGGIGRALVEACLSLEHRVTVVDQPRAIAAYPPPAGVEAIGLDATDEDSVATAFEAVRSQGAGLDGLVNLVGFTNTRRTLEELSLAEWNEILTGSLTSAFLLARAAAPFLRARSGAIVNTSSTFGVDVKLSGFGPYAVAKAGVINLTRALSLELAPEVRVNAIAPGLTDTAFLSGGTARPERSERTNLEKVAAMTHLKRVGQPEDMVGPILFLLGPASAYITAQTLHINGGAWS